MSASQRRRTFSRSSRQQTLVYLLQVPGGLARLAKLLAVALVVVVICWQRQAAPGVRLEPPAELSWGRPMREAYEGGLWGAQVSRGGHQGCSDSVTVLVMVRVWWEAARVVAWEN
jgi:hypothetical protein